VRAICQFEFGDEALEGLVFLREFKIAVVLVFSVAVLTAGLRAIKETWFSYQVVQDLDLVDGVGLVGILKIILIFQLKYPVFVVVASE